MRTAITLCQVAEAATGPFVFQDALEISFAKAAKAGFDDVELFLPGPDAVGVDEIKALCDKHGVGIAAVGSGAGMVKHRLSLTDPDPEIRDQAVEFLISMVHFGGRLGAPTILGSMQGKWGGDLSRDEALSWLADSLSLVGDAAGAHGLKLLYEPLNRYETNLITDLKTGVEWIEAEELGNVALLADLFHMNIEESDLAQAILDAGNHVGHVHFADSNRRAMGFGHTDAAVVLDALRQIGYQGSLSAEIFPYPDPETAASQTIDSLRALMPST